MLRRVFLKACAVLPFVRVPQPQPLRSIMVRVPTAMRRPIAFVTIARCVNVETGEEVYVKNRHRSLSIPAGAIRRATEEDCVYVDKQGVITTVERRFYFDA